MSSNFNRWLPILPVLSGIFAAIAYPPSPMAWLIWISFIPLLVFILREQSKKRLVLWGGAGGFIYGAIIMRWVFSVLPLDWLPGIAEYIGLIGALFYWSVTATIIGAGWGIYAALAAYGMRHFSSPAPRLLTLTLPWILAEYFWATALSVVWAGSGTPIGPHWTFGSLADILPAFPLLLPILAIGGPFLGSAFIILVNALIMHIYVHIFVVQSRALHILRIASVCMLVFGLFLTAFYLQGSGAKSDTIAVAVLPGDFPSSQAIPGEYTKEQIGAWERLYAQASAAAEEHAPDIFVFPEGIGLTLRNPLFAPALVNSLRVKEKPLLVIDSGVRNIQQATPRLEVLYLDADNGLIGSHGKTLLVPYGEYLPAVSKLLLAALGAGEVEETLSQFRFYAPGAKKAYPVSWNNTPFGTLPCSGVFSASLYRGLARDGAEILVNTASHTPFHHDPAFAAQVTAKAQVQAAALDRPFLQAANNGTSLIIDKKGTILSSTNQSGGALTAEILPSRAKTPYSRFGNWPVSAVLLLYGGIFARNLTKK